MKRIIAVSALALAALLSGQPALAQDPAQESLPPGQEQRPDIGELLKMLDGLPDLGNLPELKSQTATAPEFDPSKPVVGIGFQVGNGQVRIAQVMEGSAAEAAGLETGMLIEKINGARLSTFSMDEIGKLIAAIDGELTFTIRDTGDVKLHKAPVAPQGS